MGKWMRRNRARTALLGGALAALIAVALVSTLMNVRLTAARRLLAQHAEQQRKDLVRLQVQTGVRLTEQGDGFAALGAFAEAAYLDRNDPERLATHQLRFAATLAQLPRLER